MTIKVYSVAHYDAEARSEVVKWFTTRKDANVELQRLVDWGKSPELISWEVGKEELVEWLNQVKSKGL